MEALVAKYAENFDVTELVRLATDCPDGDEVTYSKNGKYKRVFVKEFITEDFTNDDFSIKLASLYGIIGDVEKAAFLNSDEKEKIIIVKTLDDEIFKFETMLTELLNNKINMPGTFIVDPKTKEFNAQRSPYGLIYRLESPQYI
ncbi:hypothetical protein P4679_25725 [Priestia megaterium]|uniref:hypothetical protein n=1 Tax=Priestia megaterium TaxID=1404 RepID=UPI002E250863|nr:hypothetical protein [Priestia megaterium]